jgi:hypothetical protein
MTLGWVRLSDDFYDHPKFVDAGPLALALWITGMGYCNRNLTDGLIPKSVAARLVDFDGIMLDGGGNDLCGVVYDDHDGQVASHALWQLLLHGLWHEDGHDCRSCVQPGPRKYVVHDYLEYQPSAQEVRDLAAKRASAGKRGAESRWGKAGAKASAMANGIAKPVAERWQNDAPNPNPNPNPNSDGGYVEDCDSPYVPRALLRPIPDDWEPHDGHRLTAEHKRVDLDTEAHEFRAHALDKGRQSADWNAAFDRWLGRAGVQAQHSRPMTHWEDDITPRQHLRAVSGDGPRHDPKTGRLVEW